MAFTKIVGAGIHTLSNVNTHNINSSGIITATQFVGIFTGTDGDFSGNVTIDGNLTVNGTTTTLDTNLTEVDKVEVAANNSTVGVAITQSGSGDLLRLYDGASQKVTVDDQGFVGIGSTNPQYALDISNAASSGMRIGVGTHAYLIRANVNSTNDYGVFIEDEEGTDMYNARGPHATSSPNIHVFSTAGTKKLEITPTGRIEQSNNNEDIDMDTAANGQLKLDGNGYNAAFALNAQGLNIYHNSANRAIIFGTNEDEKVRIMNTGEVGIGTDNAQSLLHLRGTGGSSSGIRFDNSHDTLFQYFTNDSNDSDFLITYNGTGGAELTIHADGRLGLNESNGSNVLIGTASAIDNSKLTIVKAAAGFTTAIALGNGNAGGIGSKIISTKALVLSADYDANNTDDKSYLGFETDGTEKLRIDSSGNVDITTGHLSLDNDKGIFFDGTTTTKDTIWRNSSENSLNMGSRYHINLFIDSNNDDTNAYFAVNKDYTTKASATELFRVQSDGKVGIGTDDPGSLLQVGTNTDGKLTFDGANTLAITGPEGGAARIDLIADQGDDAADKWRITNTSGNEFKIQRTTSHIDALSIDTSGNITAATNPSSSKVGIGTDNPQEKLHITDPGNPKILIEDTDSSNQVGVRFKTPTQDWIAGLHGGAASFKISKSDAFGVNDYFTIDGNGNVGIGTDDPAGEIDIWSVSPNIKLVDTNPYVVGQYGNISQSGGVLQLTAKGDGATHGSIYFYAQNNSETLNLYRTSDNTHQWYTASDSNSMKMRLLDDGNLGIGTGTPQSILDVRQKNDGGQTKIMLWNTDNDNTTTQTAGFFMSPDSRAYAYTGISVEKEVADMSSNAGRDVSLVLSVSQNNSESKAVRIKSDGRVLITCPDNSRALEMNPGSNAGSMVFNRNGYITSMIRASDGGSNVAGASGGGSRLRLGKTQIYFDTFVHTTNLGDAPTYVKRLHIEANGMITIDSENPDGAFRKQNANTYQWTGSDTNSNIPSGVIGLVINNNDQTTHKTVSLIEFRTFRNSSTANPGNVYIGAVDPGEGTTHSSDFIIASKRGGTTVDERLRITHDGVVQLNIASNARIRGGIYAKYTGASGNTANINTSSAGKVSWLQTNTEIFENGGFTNTATDVTVPFDGIYMVTFNGFVSGTGSGQRTNIRFRYRINGTDSDTDQSLNNYIRYYSSHNESSVNFTAYLNLTAGDTVAISAIGETTITTDVVLVKNKSSLTFHLVA